MSVQELPTIYFKSAEAWINWLHQNHQTPDGLWLKLAKKGSGLPTVTYAEALEVALCYGWIDGQKKSFDDTYWLQKFTPRRPKSIWSKINRQKAESLIAAGKMQPAGLLEVERAKEDGRWQAAYDSQSKAAVPDDLQAALDASPTANAFFQTLNSRNRYAILHRIQTAKRPATRTKRIHEFIEMLERNELLYP
jgi:uncharacterized protein YdeI (YjbR/CyaY-like superfamily)